MNRVESEKKLDAEQKHPAGIRFGTFCAFSVALTISACSSIPIEVGTEDPLKVDLNMEVHVYQHGETDEKEKKARAGYKDVVKSRRDRMTELQELKDNRLLGENRRGLLDIRNLPAGDYGKYVKDTVKAENDDREFLIQHEAEQKGDPVDDVRRLHWRQWQRKSFPGEWIEVEGETEGTYLWEQKQGSDGSTEGTKPSEERAGDEN